MFKKKIVVFHPYLFAIQPVLFFFNQNKQVLFFSETFLPICVLITTSFLLLYLFKYPLKTSAKAGIIATTIINLFFFYESIFDSINKNNFVGFLLDIDPHLFFTYGFICVSLFVGLKISKKDFYGTTRFLNASAFIFILLPLIDIGTQSFTSPIKGIDNKLGANFNAPPKTNFKGVKPDIYYIILDAYARKDTLKKSYNYDNSEFIQSLEEKGFYVASKSRSNYSVTALSLASSLNMKYLDETDIEDINNPDTTPLHKMVENNAAVRYLKSIGYKYIHFPSDDEMTEKNVHADNYSLSDSLLNGKFIEKLLSVSLAKQFQLFDPIKRKRRLILSAFDGLSAISRSKDPTFVFAHLLTPHDPFVFKEDGETPNKNQVENNIAKQYLDQLTYTNTKVSKAIDQILKNSDTPPIIILQSDHGPEYLGACSKPDISLLRDRMFIINAYYLPESIRKNLNDSITPVNTFRLIFDNYFGTELGLLKNKSVYTFCYNNLYKFVSVPENILSSKLTEKTYELNKSWISSLEKSIKKYPSFVFALNTVSNRYINIGNFKKAEKYLKKSINIQPRENDTAHFLLSRVYSELGDYEKEIKTLKKGMEFGNHPLLYNSLGVRYFEIEKPLKGIETLKQCLQFHPNNFSCQLNLGKVYLNSKSFESAEKQLLKVIAMYPKSYESYLTLGRLYNQVKQYPKAIKSFKTSIEIKNKVTSGDYLQARIGLNEVYSKLNQFEDVIRESKRTIELFPLSFEAHSNMGAAYAMLNEINQAEQAFLQSLKIKPADENTIFNLSKLYRSKNDWESSNIWLEKLLKINNSHVKAYLAMALNNIKMERFDIAKTLYEKGLQIAPNNLEGNLNLGVVYTHLNLNDRAINQLKKVLLLKPDLLQAHLQLADIYLKVKNNNAKALTHYNKALKLTSKPQEKELIAKMIKLSTQAQ
jgi:tetratricopeptide (TPR) repeat protein